MKFYLTILTTLLLLSCRKEKPEGENAEIIGKYEWSWTRVINMDPGSGFTSASYVYASGSTDKYGIEVTSKGKIFLYRNGKFEDHFRIISISYQTDGSKHIECSKAVSFIYKNNEILSHDFPSLYPDRDIDYVNYFIKK